MCTSIVEANKQTFLETINVCQATLPQMLQIKNGQLAFSTRLILRLIVKLLKQCAFVEDTTDDLKLKVNNNCLTSSISYTLTVKKSDVEIAKNLENSAALALEGIKTPTI